MKRSSPDSNGDPPTATTETNVKRKRLVTFEPIRLSHVESTKHQDAAARRFSGKKLAERLKGKQKVENELRERIKQAEKRQNVDDSMMLVMNRHWNQLNEDVRVLLQRFDAETSLDEPVSKLDKQTPNEFVTMLASGDDEELQSRCAQRVEFTLRAVRKLVCVFDGQLAKNNEISETLVKLVADGDDEEEKTNKIVLCEHINTAIVARNGELQEQNSKLQQQLSKMQTEARQLKLAAANYEDSVELAETMADDAKNLYENCHWELEKNIIEMEQLDFRFAEVARDRVTLEAKLAAKCEPGSNQSHSGDDNPDSLANVTKARLEQLEVELSDQREMAESRLGEINDYIDKIAKLDSRVVQLQTQSTNLPGAVIEQSAEYRSLHTQFNRLYSDAERFRRKCETAHEQMMQMRQAHTQQIERITSDERLAQHELQQEVMAQDEQLGQVRREYEMLRLEFEQTLANNDQSGPLSKEVRQQYVSLVKENQQHKQETARYKRKWRDQLNTNVRQKKEIEAYREQRDTSLLIPLSSDVVSANIKTECVDADDAAAKSPDAEFAVADDATIDDVRKKLSAAVDAMRATKTENGDGAPSGSTSIVQQLKMEKGKLEEEVRKWHAMDDETKANHHNDELKRRCSQLEELNERLKKEANSAKDEEDTLMQEMESTGQAFEDMQEQNQRLLQQLKEKDDANFKLMTERIRMNHSQKKFVQEYEMQQLTVAALQTQTEAANQAVKHQQECDAVLKVQNEQINKELNLRNMSYETSRRRVAELSQTSADLKLQLEKTNSQLGDAQGCIHDKTHSFETLQSQMRRNQEEMDTLRRRLERAKKFEKADRVDEVYLEEIRELKTFLTCAACNRNRKDTMLDKCAHTFCMECLKKRYDCRRRKCPNCSLPFGLNDFRRIYL